MTNEVAVRSAVSELAITPEQTRFNEMQVAGLKQLGVEDAPQAQLDVFFHRCRTTRLDPFAKQIYLIGRKTKVGGYNGEPERYEVKYTIQTGIDGYRLNGKRAAKREGNKLAFEGPYWHDGNDWSDVWLGGNRPPVAAKYVIYVDGVPHAGIAMYAEYVQTTGYGSNTKPNSMWAKMPANQTAKCAEAQAWRKAYPDDFSDLVLEDAAQIIDPDGAPVERTRVQSERVTAAGIIEARRPAASDPGEKPDNAQADEPTAEKAATKRKPRTKQIPPVTDEQLQQAKALLEQLGTPQDKMRSRVSEVLDLPLVIEDVRSLTREQGDRLIEVLTARAAKATPGQVTAVIAAMDRDRIPEDERLNWARTAMHNPDLAALEDLTSEQADEIVIFLTTADEPQGDGEQLPMDGAEGGE